MKRKRPHDLLDVINATPRKTKRVQELIEEVINHPNPYNFRPDSSHLTLQEEAALVRAFDGYGLRYMLKWRWGEEAERRLWARAHDKNYVPDPLEVIQEIP